MIKIIDKIKYYKWYRMMRQLKKYDGIQQLKINYKYEK